MANEASFTTLIDALTKALVSASDSASKLQAPIPPKDGISLLDVKNEIFLSYLQNLVFLILLKIRHRMRGTGDTEEDLQNSVIKKLVELQLYLEKGVRPLESRLKYQIDKVLRAADDAKRVNAVKALKLSDKPSRADGTADSDHDNDTDSSNELAVKASEVDDLQYRPNPAAFTRPVAAIEAESRNGSDYGIYKPPRIQATFMPSTGLRDKEAKKANKSAILDEFVNTELSTAPMIVPSIGSTIVKGGRRNLSEKERNEERERKEYEERNYVRLPKESRTQRANKGGRKGAGYGGEEWRDLGEGIDRIDRLTTRKASERRNALDKSRKRAAEEGLKGSGNSVEAGERFQKRIKALDDGRRDRGRR